MKNYTFTVSPFWIFCFVLFFIFFFIKRRHFSEKTQRINSPRCEHTCGFGAENIMRFIRATAAASYSLWCVGTLNLQKIADMQIDVTIKRHKWGWIGHTLRKDESSVPRQAMKWNPLDGIGRSKQRSCETCRRTVKKECKNLNKIWSDMKQLPQSRVQDQKLILQKNQCFAKHFSQNTLEVTEL